MGPGYDSPLFAVSRGPSYSPAELTKTPPHPAPPRPPTLRPWAPRLPAGPRRDRHRPNPAKCSPSHHLSSQAKRRPSHLSSPRSSPSHRHSSRVKRRPSRRPHIASQGPRTTSLHQLTRPPHSTRSRPSTITLHNRPRTSRRPSHRLNRIRNHQVQQSTHTATQDRRCSPRQHYGRRTRRSSTAATPRRLCSSAMCQRPLPVWRQRSRPFASLPVCTHDHT